MSPGRHKKNFISQKKILNFVALNHPAYEVLSYIRSTRIDFTAAQTLSPTAVLHIVVL
jgi:hypothetical protein